MYTVAECSLKKPANHLIEAIATTYKQPFAEHSKHSRIARIVYNNDAQRAQQIPMDAQVLSGEPLAEYLEKNQDLFEVAVNLLNLKPHIELNPATKYKNMVMDLEFVDHKHNAAVLDESDNGDDIPERLMRFLFY
ncbi:hypothetical protein TELCIR_21694 [Teladorsagia circumcincta]|uniref:Uncharacterized protein n=1 Tax=Teladorsagia circumcincta TaxID=45464 RepID=A0A2G9TG26_TELCI|nr:hypothetical protein TELCIR_21694 [Teladorsagia circumcincta]